jgi:hypothetical protein
VAKNNIILYQEAQAGLNYYPPSWTINTNSDLIYGFPVGTGTLGTSVPSLGNWGLDGTSGDPTVLSDGTLGYQKPLSVTAGPPSSGAGSNIVYSLQTNSSPMGFEITNITVYAGWLDSGRRAQAYQVLYSTVEDPTNFLPLFTVQYLPDDPTGGNIASRTKLISNHGVLAHNVAALFMDFNVPVLNNYSPYDEIEINGVNSTSLYSPVAPVIAFTSSAGGNLIVEGTGGTAYASFTWVSATNLTPPIVWTPVASGALDSSGSFSNAIPMNPLVPQSFFRLRVP